MANNKSKEFQVLLKIMPTGCPEREIMLHASFHEHALSQESCAIQNSTAKENMWF